MVAMLHDNLENGHREPRRFVHNPCSGVFPVDIRCSFDSWCELKIVGDGLISRTPKRGQKLTHLSLIKGSGLTDEDTSGLARCQLVFSS